MDKDDLVTPRDGMIYAFQLTAIMCGNIVEQINHAPTTNTDYEKGLKDGAISVLDQIQKVINRALEDA